MPNTGTLFGDGGIIGFDESDRAARRSGSAETETGAGVAERCGGFGVPDREEVNLCVVVSIRRIAGGCCRRRTIQEDLQEVWTKF